MNRLKQNDRTIPQDAVSASFFVEALVRSAQKMFIFIISISYDPDQSIQTIFYAILKTEALVAVTLSTILRQVNTEPPKCQKQRHKQHKLFSSVCEKM